MKNYIKHHPWHIIEEGFDTQVNRVSESIFSIGNGKFGQRANFEEKYSGDTLEGNYVAGVYYPDKTRVGWWKNGYPEYFAKVLNAPNWIGLNITVDDEELDLALCEVSTFNRTLDMQKGLLHLSFTAKMKNGITVTAKITRFCSLAKSNLGAISYSFSLNKDATVSIESSIDGTIVNADSNYDEKFWIGVDTLAKHKTAQLIAKTKKTDFYVGVITDTQIVTNGEQIQADIAKTTKKYASTTTVFKIKKGTSVSIEKKAIIISSLDYEKADIQTVLET